MHGLTKPQIGKALTMEIREDTEAKLKTTIGQLKQLSAELCNITAQLVSTLYEEDSMLNSIKVDKKLAAIGAEIDGLLIEIRLLQVYMRYCNKVLAEVYYNEG